LHRATRSRRQSAFFGSDVEAMALQDLARPLFACRAGCVGNLLTCVPMATWARSDRVLDGPALAQPRREPGDRCRAGVVRLAEPDRLELEGYDRKLWMNGA
jgi:hypothetical protein